MTDMNGVKETAFFLGFILFLSLICPVPHACTQTETDGRFSVFSFTNSDGNDIASPDTCIKGDVNLDGAVNIIDCVLTINFILNQIELDPVQICAADCNDDGEINILDLICIVKKILGVFRPSPEIIFPEDGTVVSDITLIVAEETSSLSPFEIYSALFEYSTDGVTWTEIWNETDLLGDRESSFFIWDAMWDTRSVPSGFYFIRVVMETFDGQTAWDRIMLEVNKPPISIATATQIQEVGEVLFDGSQSEDTDGSVTSWKWDFGDGEVATGPVIEHVYTDLTLSYEVMLTVSDDRDIVSSSHYTLSFPFCTDTLLFQETEKCECTSIAVRKEGKALGPDGESQGDKEKGWGKTNGFDDGIKLGPVHDNPEDSTVNGEKKYTSYAFEILCEVKGNPDNCKEIQVVKRTSVQKGLTKKQCEENGGTWNDTDKTCTLDKTWKGKTADLDKNGTNDIDVSDEDKCKKAGGKWDGKKCTLKFPKSGEKYGPDVPDDTDAGGAYEDKFDYKKRPDKKIIWYDTPYISGVSNGSTYKADFIAIVKGSDPNGKYCYVKFTLDLERKEGKDKEELTAEDPVIGADSVPGVPKPFSGYHVDR